MTAVQTPRARSLEFGAFFNTFVIAVTAFLTVVDLFATQAILPALAVHYGVAPSAMGVAVNATTLGMAISGLGVALFSARIERRTGIMASLFALAVPTFLLAFAQDLLIFTLLRVVQGVLMAAAFTLTLAYLGERCSMRAAAGAFAAYITGNVASNLFGRLLAAGLVDHFGIATNFLVFAALNAAGGVLVYFTIRSAQGGGARMMAAAPWAALVTHMRNPALRVAFAIGFLILFAFIGVFTYINFVLVKAPFAVTMMSLGLVYFVFLPSIITTPLAGRVVQGLGARRAMWIGLSVALAGLPLLLAQFLPLVLLGMAVVAIGTFFAQAVATGFVSSAASADRGAASGLYLASYFLGGLVGSFVIGQAFDRFGWPAAVAGVAIAVTLAGLLAIGLRTPKTSQ
ncbi:MAG: MFS transporter [Alphaproteobacteria bacterium]|nr:MFS transporter [Alphaproteobacteria bacterium]